MSDRAGRENAGLGAKTPKYRTAFTLGGGTSAGETPEQFGARENEGRATVGKTASHPKGNRSQV